MGCGESEERERVFSYRLSMSRKSVSPPSLVDTHDTVRKQSWKKKHLGLFPSARSVCVFCITSIRARYTWSNRTTSSWHFVFLSPFPNAPHSNELIRNVCDMTVGSDWAHRMSAVIVHNAWNLISLLWYWIDRIITGIFQIIPQLLLLAARKPLLFTILAFIATDRRLFSQLSVHTNTNMWVNSSAHTHLSHVNEFLFQNFDWISVSTTPKCRRLTCWHATLYIAAHISPNKRYFFLFWMFIVHCCRSHCVKWLCSIIAGPSGQKSYTYIRMSMR